MKLETSQAQQTLEKCANKLKEATKESIESGGIRPENEIDFLIDRMRLGIFLHFIVTEEDGETIVTLFDTSLSHAEVVDQENQESFIGAGEFNRYLADWGAASLEKDRPDNDKKGTRILEEIDREIETWITNFYAQESVTA